MMKTLEKEKMLEEIDIFAEDENNLDVIERVSKFLEDKGLSLKIDIESDTWLGNIGGVVYKKYTLYKTDEYTERKTTVATANVYDFNESLMKEDISTALDDISQDGNSVVYAFKKSTDKILNNLDYVVDLTWLERIDVKAKYRNQGIGRNLVQLFIAECLYNRNGTFVVQADMNSDCEKLIRFYKRCGLILIYKNLKEGIIVFATDTLAQVHRK